MSGAEDRAVFLDPLLFSEGSRYGDNFSLLQEGSFFYVTFWSHSILAGRVGYSGLAAAGIFCIGKLGRCKARAYPPATGELDTHGSAELSR